MQKEVMMGGSMQGSGCADSTKGRNNRRSIYLYDSINQYLYKYRKRSQRSDRKINFSVRSQIYDVFLDVKDGFLLFEAYQ